MIESLGIKRILVFVVLLVINLSLGGALYFVLMPQNDDLSSQISSLESQITGKRSDTDRLRKEYDEIQSQKVYLSYLTVAGFFSDQSRVMARQRIDEIQKFSKILSATYNIEAGKVEDNAAAKEADYVVLDSPVKINIDALDDLDFFNFVYWLENGFPGQVQVKDMSLSRVHDINEATLRQIGTGGPITLIQGTVDFEWRTMVPEKTVKAVDNGKTTP